MNLGKDGETVAEESDWRKLSSVGMMYECQNISSAKFQIVLCQLLVTHKLKSAVLTRFRKTISLNVKTHIIYVTD